MASRLCRARPAWSAPISTRTNLGFVLRSTSRYAPIQGTIDGWVNGSSRLKGCTAELFVELIVDATFLESLK
ncbi:hypothetical protein F4778DRAFT_747250 [Xylariomycetidae sp. FL2044]|nr:hypothetical protein F4778DRAFT_747250 [Xylariomycetidae sp. FL2044]